jgi:hypothetical protein
MTPTPTIRTVTPPKAPKVASSSSAMMTIPATGKTLKQYEEELRTRTKQQHQQKIHDATSAKQSILTPKEYDHERELKLHALLQTNPSEEDILAFIMEYIDEDDEDDEYAVESDDDSFYSYDSDSDEIPYLQAPNIAIEELTTEGYTTDTAYYYCYPDPPLTDNAILPDPDHFDVPPEYLSFANYADRAIATCHNQEH